MQNQRQAKIWRNKIEWFGDGEVKKIKVATQKGNKFDIRSVWAICKKGVAIHTNVLRDDTISKNTDYFSVTHLESGMFMLHVRKDELNLTDYNEWVDRVNQVWEGWSDNQKIEAGLSLTPAN